MKIVITVGARPNFVKAAPIIKELKRKGHLYTLIHTGQHYDYEMSKVFFEDLEIPDPQFHLEGMQRERYVHAIKEIARLEKPDFSIVLGDTDSSLAAALGTSRVCKTVHVEAGLRSRNLKMREELNRIVIDHISDIHFCTEISAVKNLCDEGITGILVGNVMIDTLRMMINKDLENVNFEYRNYGVLTIHRMEKDRKTLERIFRRIKKITEEYQIIFPVHPRMEKYSDLYKDIGLTIVKPMRYVEFVNLVNLADFIITDSGGVQEEASYLNVPCFTIRDETERPITVTHGTNKIVYEDARGLKINKTEPEEKEIPMWDGKTSQRIISFLEGLA